VLLLLLLVPVKLTQREAERKAVNFELKCTEEEQHLALPVEKKIH
jgi:hypothetical protein